MGDIWTSVKPILEAGALGGMLILVIRLWVMANRIIREEMEKRVQAEREHGKELLRIQTDHSHKITDILQKYEQTLRAVHTSIQVLSDTIRE